jgi:hypothetical protein
MSDGPQNKAGAPSGDSFPRGTNWAWGFVALQLVLFFAGCIVFKEAVYGPGHGVAGLWIALGAWSLGVFAGVCALQVVYGFRVAAESKSGIVTLAVLGLVLNAIPLVLLCLLYVGLQGIGR